MKKKTLQVIIFLLPTVLSAQTEKKKDEWHPFKFFVGAWDGIGDGKWGTSTVAREYEFIMDGTFLLGKNKSVYEKQEKNPNGEIHDNWDIFSYDRPRKKFVLRQFHDESFVNQFVADSLQVNESKFEFTSEAIENFGSGWRLKEAYDILNESEFTETFFMAAPGKEFQIYVRNHFKRKK